MIVDCISDLHGFVPPRDLGDLLIVAGDLTARDRPDEHFAIWGYLSKLNYVRVIVIAGNHDNFLQTKEGEGFIRDFAPNLQYLCDESTTFGGYKIWGSPWTSRFEGINPHCCAFTGKNDKEIAPKWDLIPTDTDILITHSPPFTVRDLTTSGHQVGSSSLMAHHISRLRPKLWVFGHIHEAYGTDGPYQWNGTKYVNASHVNEQYKPVNKPIRIILEEKREYQEAGTEKDLRSAGRCPKV